jgi:glycosyltransferase involved in cell wall biosynthesis
MSSQLVSVIIPCYNGAQFVGDAIENALSQTYPNVEVVVVDDGSTDDSLQVIRSFGDRVRWESLPNGGACRARNRGAVLAQGDLLQFLDADDLLYPQKIDEQVALISSGGFDSVFCDVAIVPFDGSAGAVVSKHARHVDPVIAALGPNAGTTAALHRRAAFFAIGGFRPDLVAAQERDLHLRLACSGKSFGCLEQVLATQRIRAGSISSSYLRVVQQYESIVTPLFHDMLLTDRMSETRARAFADFMARAARVAIRFQDHALADRYFALARSMHPSGGLHGAYGRLGRLMHRSVGPRCTAFAARWVWGVRKGSVRIPRPLIRDNRTEPCVKNGG